MSTTFRGGCLCGAIRYEITAGPMIAGQCQCLDCQRETGGGHASFMAFPADAVQLTGTPRFYEAKADSGTRSGAALARPAARPSSAVRAACRT